MGADTTSDHMPAKQGDADAAAHAAAHADQLRAFQANIETVILGKPHVVRQVVVGLLAGGHVLIEDVPGTGKSTLARALAKSLDCDYRRIQFTPDLLPSDITGISILNADTHEFEFKAGPVFANILLADEINRTTPRTQSALLEAMNVGQVTVDGLTHDLPRPFMVIATQNPLEYTGTYPLPEAQLDRFALRLKLDFPAREYEKAMLTSRRLVDPLDALQPVLTGPEVVTLAAAVRRVRVEDPVIEYLQDLVAATREHPRLLAGASPRASLSLFRLGQALAFLEGRDYVLPDDIRELAVEALAHRVVTREQAAMPGAGDGADIIRAIVGALAVPR